jgi:hypothetical protein
MAWSGGGAVVFMLCMTLFSRLPWIPQAGVSFVVMLIVAGAAGLVRRIGEGSRFGGTDRNDSTGM